MQVYVANVIDIIFVVSLIIAFCRGWHIGLVMRIAHLGMIVGSCIAAHFIANLLKGSIGNAVILPLLQKQSDGNISAIPFAEKGITYVADTFAYYILFGISFIIAMIVLSQLIHIFKLVDYIPLIGKINKIGGALVGLIIQCIVFFLICSFVFCLIPQDTLNSWGLSKTAVSNTYVLQFFVR